MSKSRPLSEAPYTKEYRVRFWCNTDSLAFIHEFVSAHNPSIPVYCDTEIDSSYWAHVCALTQYQYRLLKSENIKIQIPRVCIIDFLGVTKTKRNNNEND